MINFFIKYQLKYYNFHQIIIFRKKVRLRRWVQIEIYGLSNTRFKEVYSIRRLKIREN